jgi:metal-responsive CopG/Arc/MetJ family transcriptional regulator
VPPELLREFDRAAQEHGLSRSEAIREAMRLYIRYSRAPEAKSLKGLAAGSKIPVETLEAMAPTC